MSRWWPWGRSETKASAAGGAVSAWNLGRPVWTPRNYAQLADEAYVRNAVAYRCVKLIAGSAASAPWLLSAKGGKALEEHALLDLLRRPAPGIGGNALFEAVFAYILLSGNTYLEEVGPDGKPPRELWSLRPDRMSVIPSAYGTPAAYEYEAHGIRKRWEVDPLTGQGPILHVREFHPLNDWYGLARSEPAAYGIDRHNAASAHNKALLDNGARPAGALVFEPVKLENGQTISAPAPVIEAAQKELTDRTGPKHAGRPFVFGGNIRWEEMGHSPRDMDFGAGKDDSARDICVSFGVPHILIVPGQSTYNNVREAKLELWEDTVLPLLDKVTDALDAWLTPQYGDALRLGVDLDEISALEFRRETKRKTVVELLEKGVIDDDEAREALQYGPRSKNAVKKVDGQVLKALVDAFAEAPAMFEPLFRYLSSTGLVAPGTTVEQLLELADRLLARTEDDGDGEEDANIPKPADGNAEEPADEAAAGA